jgi:Ca2+-binding EF-hand superfamily protein
MGLFSFTALLAELADIQAQARLGAEKTLQERLIELNEVIDQDDNGKVTADEYIIFNLKKMGKVDDMAITLLKDQFKALDADGSGELDADDISLLTQAAEQVENEERSARHQEVS